MVERDVEQLERKRIDHVLGIVQHHHAEGATPDRFLVLQRPIETVEAVGLGSRPKFGIDNHAHASILFLQRPRDGQRLGIVGIASD